MQNLPQDVTEIVETLLAGVHGVLKEKLVALYLRGSLVTGDFEPEASDVDFWAVTDRPVSEQEFAALSQLHIQLGRLPNRYGDQLEGPYIDRAATRRYQPGQRHPTIGRGEELKWTKHGYNWLLERWMLREAGLTLFGPEPQALIDPVPPEALRQAILLRLPDWDAWARQPDDPDWQLHRGHKAYVVETMCRVLYTLATGKLASKPQAVAWAITELPEPWCSTALRSQIWHNDQTLDPALNPEVIRFVLWVTEANNQNKTC
jgi:hypothetical protein